MWGWDIFKLFGFIFIFGGCWFCMMEFVKEDFGGCFWGWGWWGWVLGYDCWCWMGYGWLVCCMLGMCLFFIFCCIVVIWCDCIIAFGICILVFLDLIWLYWVGGIVLVWFIIFCMVWSGLGFMLDFGYFLGADCCILYFGGGRFMYCCCCCCRWFFSRERVCVWCFRRIFFCIICIFICLFIYWLFWLFGVMLVSGILNDCCWDMDICCGGCFMWICWVWDICIRFVLFDIWICWFCVIFICEDWLKWDWIWFWSCCSDDGGCCVCCIDTGLFGW